MEPMSIVPSLQERRLELIHRVLIADGDSPKEYAILVTDQRSIFIRQPKTRSGWVLRREMRFGTALVTDVEPKTLDDYEGISVGSLANDGENLVIPHDGVASLKMRADPPEHRRREFFIYWVMKRQKEIFQVYNFEMEYSSRSRSDASVKFYAVPLGMYFKPKRMTQTRETILREYAQEIMEIYLRVMPNETVRSLIQTNMVPERSHFQSWSKQQV